MERAGVRGASQAEPDDPDTAREPGGPLALPGEYTVQIVLGADTAHATFQVLPDPRVEYDEATARVVVRLHERLLDVQRRATAVADRIRDARETVGRIQELIDVSDQPYDSLEAHGERMDEALEDLYHTIVGERGQRTNRPPNLVTTKLGAASRQVTSGRWAAPSQAALRNLERAEDSVDELEVRVSDWFESEWVFYRRAVVSSGLGLFGGG